MLKQINIKYIWNTFQKVTFTEFHNVPFLSILNFLFLQSSKIHSLTHFLQYVLSSFLRLSKLSSWLFILKVVDEDWAEGDGSSFLKFITLSLLMFILL